MGGVARRSLWRFRGHEEQRSRQATGGLLRERCVLRFRSKANPNEMKTLDSGTIEVTVDVSGDRTPRVIAFQLRLEFWAHCRLERLNRRA